MPQGPERVKGLYAFRSLIDSGARITLGSDFPVESMNPLSGFYAAVTRVSPDGKSPHGPGGWYIRLHAQSCRLLIITTGSRSSVLAARRLSEVNLVSKWTGRK